MMRSRTTGLTIGLFAVVVMGLVVAIPARTGSAFDGPFGLAPTTTATPPTTEPPEGRVDGTLTYSPAAPFRLEPMHVSLLLEVRDGSAWDLQVSVGWELSGPSCSAVPGNPVELLGDGDVVLEPGEQWRYDFDCLGGEVLMAVVTGRMAGAERCFSSDIIAEQPLAVAVEPDAPAVPAGERATWDVMVENVGPYPFVDVTAKARNLWGDSVEYQPLGAPVGRTGDDEILDPGETWTYSYEATMTAEDFLAEAVVEASPQHATEVRHLESGHAEPVEPAAPPGTTTTIPTTTVPTTTTPSTPLPDPVDELPATGSGSMLAVAGVFLLGVGVLVILVGRRRAV